MNSWHRLWFYLMVGLALFWPSLTPLYAKSDGSANKLIEYLVQEKNNLTQGLNETKLVAPPANQAEYDRACKKTKPC